ncbi:MAG: hypothetical protein CVU05_13990 [Bacteroidetes bacterium HGW-Bacteroidetes-21]|jgi:hypothetical protein|nr:MAG: hypothetical protein CVU05_13990 [Bacteroidetes bacterium HGW-Bacteroidetes-21]
MVKQGVLKQVFFFAVITLIAFTSCKKDKTEPEEEKGTIKIGMSDARSPHSNKSEGIINSTELTKCQITISSIKVKNTSGSYIDLLTTPTNVDLRLFQGTVSNLINTPIPVGSYTAVQIGVSGVSTTYQGNNYTASLTSGASITIANPSMTISQGVTNAFAAGAITSEMPLSFTVGSSSDVESIRLFFDADASTYVASFDYQTYTWNFAGIRPLLQTAIILEQGIQQIRHSPPYGITIVGGGDVNYYGIHTFMDFNAKGGTINSHTSQHVFRGEDGTLLVDAEAMAVNSNPLTPTDINATGETDVHSDETFKYAQILVYLAGQGYTLESGKTYYFSLRKTWNISTNGQTYNLTRICEPIPLTIP